MNVNSIQNSYRILVVDDDEMLNDLFCSFLSSKGFDTVSAHGITDARAVLEKDDDIDLILLDYQMEDGVGTDLLKPETMSNYKSLAPVIMISVNEEPAFLERCFAVGVDDYIIKPVNLSLLALKVEALIKSVSMQRLISLQNAELERFKQEAEREERIAKFTYEYLLQQNSHNYDGVNVWLKSFAAFSGDIVLVKKSPSGNLYFILADATGHGLAAAITIMPVVTIFNSMVNKGFHLQQIVTELNRKLVNDTPGDRFVAAVLIEMDPNRREFCIWNGAMPPVFWVKDGKITQEFHSTHMALGIMPEEAFDANITILDLPDDGFLLAYSDGVSEQENAQEEPFSIARVKEILATQPENPIAEISNQLKLYAGTENYHDDVTLCTLQPAEVFKEAMSGVGNDELSACCRSNVFFWQVKLSGRQLEQCEIPPMCNHFLQQLAIDQQSCQKIFTLVAEMTSNAIDHGVLKLDSRIKENPDGFVQYFQLREERLRLLGDEDFVQVSLQWLPSEPGGILVVEVEDSGSGYTAQRLANADTKFSGRGMQLIRQLSESVEIFPPGNKIRATIK